MSLLILLLASSVLRAETADGWFLRLRGDGTHHIVLQQSGAPSEATSLQALLDLIDSLDDKQPLDLRFIGFTALFRTDEIQRELLAEFTKKYPQLLAQAKASSGNMHNPKVVPLRAAFGAALLATPAVREIDNRLARLGYTVSGESSEKFALDKSTDPISFSGIVFLEVAPLAEKRGPAPHGRRNESGGWEIFTRSALRFSGRSGGMAPSSASESTRW